MACYVDTSVWIALLGKEAAHGQIAQWFSKGVSLRTSPWTGVEIASGLGIKVRRGDILAHAAQAACDAYEQLLGSDVMVLSCDATDFKNAQLYCQQVDTGLRAGDALHLAIALRHACSHFFCLDANLSRNAQAAGLQLISLEN